MVTFHTSLSAKGFQNLVNELQIYADKLEQAKTDILEALADYAYERIMYYLNIKPTRITGTLMSSFVVEVSKDIARVYTDLYYAKYVEFGTGIRGSASNYDTKNTSIKSLSYSTEIQGQPAQKFVYRAVQDLERDYKAIARNVLKEKGLI